MLTPTELLLRAGAERFYRIVQVPAPAAGADWLLAAQGGAIWELLTIRARLVTTGVAGNRQPRFSISDGTTVFCEAGPSNAIGINNTAKVCGVAGLGTSYLNFDQFMFPLMSPPILLQAGYVISVATAALDVGDQWSQIALYVRETVARGESAETAFELFEQARELGEIDFRAAQLGVGG